MLILAFLVGPAPPEVSEDLIGRLYLSESLYCPPAHAHRDLGEDVQKKREHGQVEANAVPTKALS